MEVKVDACPIHCLHGWLTKGLEKIRRKASGDPPPRAYIMIGIH
jgi:hypothetical protein